MRKLHREFAVGHETAHAAYQRDRKVGDDGPAGEEQGFRDLELRIGVGSVKAASIKG